MRDSDWQPQDSFGSVNFSTNENTSTDKVIGTIQLSSEKDYSKLKHAHLTSNDEQSKNTESSVDYVSANNDDKETKENDNVNSEVNSNKIQSEKKEHEEDSNGTPKLKCIKNQTPCSKKEERGLYGHQFIQEGNLDVKRKPHI